MLSWPGNVIASAWRPASLKRSIISAHVDGLPRHPWTSSTGSFLAAAAVLGAIAFLRFPRSAPGSTASRACRPLPIRQLAVPRRVPARRREWISTGASERTDGWRGRQGAAHRPTATGHASVGRRSRIRRGTSARRGALAAARQFPLNGLAGPQAWSFECALSWGRSFALAILRPMLMQILRLLMLRVLPRRLIPILTVVGLVFWSGGCAARPAARGAAEARHGRETRA